MKNARNDEKRGVLIAFRCGVGSLIVGFLFCGLVLATRNFFFFGLAGILVLVVCLMLVHSGLAILIAYMRRNPQSSRRMWRPWAALFILILNFPLGVKCVEYTFTHFTLYTVAIINDSQKPLNSVSLRSDDGGSTKTLALIPPEHRFATINPGKRVKVTWDARDEEGVRLRATWNGRTTDFKVTGYTLWEEPHDITVKIDPAGIITVNGAAPGKF